jgi:hypothetical protein
MPPKRKLKNVNELSGSVESVKRKKNDTLFIEGMRKDIYQR